LDQVNAPNFFPRQEDNFFEHYSLQAQTIFSFSSKLGIYLKFDLEDDSKLSFCGQKQKQLGDIKTPLFR